jgi:5'-nucleotidase
MPALPARLTIAISSSALFDLSAADAVFRGKGVAEYRRYQRGHESEPLAPGVAFPFIRRLLAVNRADPANPLVEVVLISRNDSDTGLRVRNSLDHHGLAIRRSVFTGGRPPYHHIDVFEASLFLSANQGDVEEAIRLGYPAGLVVPSALVDDAGEELRIAFDFDGVIAGDEGERVFKEQGLAGFHANERTHAQIPLSPGPLQRLLAQIAGIQASEAARQHSDPAYRPLIRTAIITARSAPADRRVVMTLREWGVQVDETYFIGDMPKDRVLRQFLPHLFFDDKPENARLAAGVVPSVHVPFGISNIAAAIRDDAAGGPTGAAGPARP